MNINHEQVLVAQCVTEKLSHVRVDVSPITRELGMVIESAEAGDLLLSFELGEQYSQGNHVIQGGAVTMALDAGLAFSALSMIQDGQSVATLNMQTQFFRPVHPGKVWVRAKVDKPGRNIMFCSAHLIDQDDRVLATAQSPLQVINL